MAATDFINTHCNEPLVSFWIGNFFEPAYSSEAFFDDAFRDLKEMGANSVNLDSKGWTDFFDFYETGSMSQYVKIQHYAVQAAEREGLSHTFLAIFSNGDNLFLVGIRDCEPRYGEQVVGPDGEPIPMYKYWSADNHAIMLEHVQGLLTAFPGRSTEVMFRGNSSVIPVKIMFTAMPKPSFDDDGVQRYQAWLESKYETIDALNTWYGTDFSSFSAISSSDYWFAIDDFCWGDTRCPAQHDYDTDSIELKKFVDNQLYRSEVARDFFAEIVPKYRALNPNILNWHLMQQWQLYFNNGAHYWFSANIGVDPWLLTPHLDTQTVIAMPVDVYSLPNSYVVSCEAAMARSLNGFDDYIGGLYLGRYMFNDVYARIAPSNSIACLAAGGAKALHIYGYNGLDDGGVIYRLADHIKANIRTGISWFKRVVPRFSSEQRRKEIAMIFPASTLLFEAQFPDTAQAEHRMDLLGWYQAILDLGFGVDFIHPTQCDRETLQQYRAVVLANDCGYRFNRNIDAESAILDYVSDGGAVIHGNPSELASAAFGIMPTPHPTEAFFMDEQVIASGRYLGAFDDGDGVAHFLGSGKKVIVSRRMGDGTIYSIGFPFGFSIASTVMPPVPHAYGKEEVSPVMLMKTSILATLFSQLSIRPLLSGQKQLEYAHFGDVTVAVNHAPVPLVLDVPMADADWLLPVDDRTLLPGGGVVFERE